MVVPVFMVIVTFWLLTNAKIRNGRKHEPNKAKKVHRTHGKERCLVAYDWWTATRVKESLKVHPEGILRYKIKNGERDGLSLFIVLFPGFSLSSYTNPHQRSVRPSFGALSRMWERPHV